MRHSNQKKSKLTKLAELFDEQSDEKQRGLGYFGLAYLAISTVVIGTGAFGAMFSFLLFMSLPGAAILCWAAFKKGEVAPALQRNATREIEAGNASTSMTVDRASLRTAPLAERESYLDAVPTQIRERRAQEVREVLEAHGGPLTVPSIARELRWSEDAVICGLGQLEESGRIHEDYPEDHDMLWRYALSDAPAFDDFDARLRASMAAHQKERGVPVATEYATLQDVDEETDIR